MPTAKAGLWCVLIGNGRLLHKWVGSEQKLNGTDRRVAVACRVDWLPADHITIVRKASSKKKLCSRCEQTQ